MLVFISLVFSNAKNKGNLKVVVELFATAFRLLETAQKGSSLVAKTTSFEGSSRFARAFHDVKQLSSCDVQ